MQKPVSRSIPWWLCGLLGGMVLSLATVAKVVRAVMRGSLDGASVEEFVGVIAAVFGMGFLCGVIVWGGKGLHRRLGFIGDSIVGLVVMVVFFSCCMLLFDRPLLGEKFIPAGVAMLSLAGVMGLFAGPWFRYEMGKDDAKPRR